MIVGRHGSIQSLVLLWTQWIVWLVGLYCGVLLAREVFNTHHKSKHQNFLKESNENSYLIFYSYSSFHLLILRCSPTKHTLQVSHLYIQKVESKVAMERTAKPSYLIHLIHLLFLPSFSLLTICLSPILLLLPFPSLWKEVEEVLVNSKSKKQKQKWAEQRGQNAK